MNRKSLVRSFVSLTAMAALAAPALAQDGSSGARTFMDGIVAVVIGLITALIALFLSLWLAMTAVKKAIDMFDKTTEGIDEWAELAKGNVSVGIVMAAMIYAVGDIISSGVQGLTHAIMAPSLSMAFVLSVVIGIINLLVALWIATTVISLAIKTLDKATKNIEEMKEIGKGNVAVGVMVAGVLLAVANVVGSAVSGLANVLNIDNLRHQFGW